MTRPANSSGVKARCSQSKSCIRHEQLVAVLRRNDCYIASNFQEQRHILIVDQAKTLTEASSNPNLLCKWRHAAQPSLFANNFFKN